MGSSFKDIPVWYLAWLKEQDFVKKEHPELYKFLRKKDTRRRIGEYYACKYEDMYGVIDPYDFCD